MPLEALPRLEPLVLRGLRRRRLALVTLAIIAGDLLVALWAAGRGMDVLEALRGPGFWLALVPSLVLWLLAATLGEWSSRRRLRLARERRVLVTNAGLVLCDEAGRPHPVPWADVLALRVSAAPFAPTRVIVSHARGEGAFGVELHDVDKPPPPCEFTWSGLRCRDPQGGVCDPRRRPAAGHALVLAITAHSGVRLPEGIAPSGPAARTGGSSDA